MRVAVTRLLAARELVRDERGRYRLGTAAAPVWERVGSWRRGEERLRRWDGGWIGVHTAGLARGRGGAAARAGRALGLLGFAAFAPGLALRPDNLRGGVAGVRDELRALGLPAAAPAFALAELAPEDDARARGLWDTAALRARYARECEALAASEARIAGRPERAAMVESFRLGGRGIRTLVRDPLLPEPLVPAAERRALLAALVRYDRAGRRVWAAFMARHGAPHASLPTEGHAAAFGDRRALALA
jgi:phenylacetic acid degradation operon negative regulatory protein